MMVIFPTDGHTGDKLSPEYKLFPPHNIVGTLGQQLTPGIKIIKAVIEFINLTKIATQPFKILILITTYANVKLIIYG